MEWNGSKETITGDKKTEQQTTKQHEHQETTKLEEKSTITTSYNEQHLTTEIKKKKTDTPEDPPEITQNNNKCVVSEQNQETKEPKTRIKQHVVLRAPTKVDKPVKRKVVKTTEETTKNRKITDMFARKITSPNLTTNRITTNLSKQHDDTRSVQSGKVKNNKDIECNSAKLVSMPQPGILDITLSNNTSLNSPPDLDKITPKKISLSNKGVGD